MTDKINERIFRIRKGEVIYITAPPYKPILVRIDPKLDDIVIEEIEPTDLPDMPVTFESRIRPEVEENAPLVQGQDRTATEVIQDLSQVDPPNSSAILAPAITEELRKQDAAILALAEGHTEQCAKRQVYDDGKCCCSKLGFTPNLPEQFNRSSEEAAIAETTKTLGPVAELYRHEKEVKGVTVFAYTNDPASPFERKPAPEPEPVPRAADLFTELREQQLQSDIPFFNEPT